MKRLSVILTIVLITMMLVPNALASVEQLSKDTANVYSGMNKSYSAGYVPTVSGNTVTVVLPLVYDGAEGIVGDTITATPDLGSTSDSPFKIKNYEKDVVLTNNSVNDGAGTVSSYLVTFTFNLVTDRVNGTYPVVINTSFEAATSGEITQSFTVYVRITDGIDPNAEEEEEEEEVEVSRPQPKIIVSDYSIDPEVVLAGEEFDINVTLKNTEDYWHAKNIIVTYKGETSDILVNSGTNTIYIDEIEDEETYRLTLEMKARLEAEPEPQKVLITIEYEDSNQTSYTVSEEIIVEIRQPLRLEMDEVSIDSTVSAGDSIPITMNVYNMGKSTIYNVLCTLEMPGAIPDGSSYLGNMESGASGTAEIYVFFGTLDMTTNSITGETSEDKYGLSQGTMTVTYEDEYGDSYEEIIEISTTIEKPVFDDLYSDDDEEEEIPEKASQWWVSVFLAIGIIMILGGVIAYRRKVNRLRRVYGDENI